MASVISAYSILESRMLNFSVIVCLFVWDGIKGVPEYKSHFKLKIHLFIACSQSVAHLY